MTLRHGRRNHHGERGAAAVLAMMFLVIFGSLAAAMAIVAQGNLSTADSHLKINRSLAAAETGMHFIIYRLNSVTANVKTTDGLIDDTNAPALWEQTRDALLASFQNEFHNLQEPYVADGSLHVGPIAVAAGAPTFTATFTPHPLPGEDYESSYYQRPPYSQMTPPVSSVNPLDATWIRIRVQATDGPAGRQITRSIQLDFKLDKKIRFAILSKSRVMIGQNVMIKGPIGSRFLETNLPNGHPVQMLSDFTGLDSELDAALTALVATLASNDMNGDNRINLGDPSEIADIDTPTQYDANGDGYIDDYDFFLAKYDTNADGMITALELDTANDIHRAQLLELIDTFGNPDRPGYNDGVIDNLDRYAKVRGQVKVTAELDGWLAGAAGGTYQNYFKGPIHPDTGESPLTFAATDNDVHSFESTDFDMTTFRNMATGDLAEQALDQASLNDPSDPDSPQPLGQEVREEVPYGSAHPYDYYDRPVYENMTFTNVKIPKGTNALFRNCNFIGVTFIETDVHNQDPNYNYAGVQEADGTLRYPDITALVNGTEVTDTRTVANNVRFDGCTFEGSIISDATPSYTHVRNKIAFTGRTRFIIDDSDNLTDDQKLLFKRSTILAPHYSIEMGSFLNPADASEVVNLSGTIVAGVIDMRGQVKINGTLMTTFEPQSDVSPVVGQTSPQFNTTLGYFPSNDGDLEAELPVGGVGVIQVRYDPTLPLPDGILGPIEVRPVLSTYFEGGAN